MHFLKYFQIIYPHTKLHSCRNKQQICNFTFLFSVIMYHVNGKKKPATGERERDFIRLSASFIITSQNQVHCVVCDAILAAMCFYSQACSSVHGY